MSKVQEFIERMKYIAQHEDVYVGYILELAKAIEADATDEDKLTKRRVKT